MSTTASIAVLHTSLLFINPDSVINEHLAELAPDADVLHFVDSDVLAAVVRDGGISPASTQRMVHLAQAAAVETACLLVATLDADATMAAGK